LGLLYLAISFSFLLNLSYLRLDEFFLLSLYFFIFFFIAYVFLKNIFKNISIINIFKKYILFVTLFKINSCYNKLLSLFFIFRKALFFKFKVKLYFFKRFLGLMLIGFFIKHKTLISLLFLSFFKMGDALKEGLASFPYVFMNKVAFYDSALCY